MRFTVPNTMKYFCVSEAISFYLQKYTAYRKRKIYVGGKKIQDLQEVIEKHNTEKFLLPSAENTNSKTIEFLDSLQINYIRGVFFKTLPKKTSIKRFSYDMVVLFSPIDVDSIIQNFPDLFTKDHDILIACFGSVTQNYAESKNLNVALKAPNEKTYLCCHVLIVFYQKNNQHFFKMSSKKFKMISSKKEIELIFKNGKHFSGKYLKFIYLKDLEKQNYFQLLISIPKKKIKLAVNRNKIKRRIKAFYYLRKNMKDSSLSVIILYKYFKPVKYIKLEKDLLQFENLN